MGGSITKTTKNSQMDIGRFEGKKTFHKKLAKKSVMTFY